MMVRIPLSFGKREIERERERERDRERECVKTYKVLICVYTYMHI